MMLVVQLTAFILFVCPANAARSRDDTVTETAQVVAIELQSSDTTPLRNDVSFPEDWSKEARAVATSMFGVWTDEQQHSYLLDQVEGGLGFHDYVAGSSTTLTLCNLTYFQGTVGGTLMRFSLQGAKSAIVPIGTLIAEKREGVGMSAKWVPMQVSSFPRRPLMQKQTPWNSLYSKAEVSMASDLLGTWKSSASSTNRVSQIMKAKNNPASFTFAVTNKGKLSVTIEVSATAELYPAGVMFEGMVGDPPKHTRVSLVEGGKRILGEQKKSSAWHIGVQLARAPRGSVFGGEATAKPVVGPLDIHTSRRRNDEKPAEEVEMLNLDGEERAAAEEQLPPALETEDRPLPVDEEDYSSSSEQEPTLVATDAQALSNGIALAFGAIGEHGAAAEALGDGMEFDADGFKQVAPKGRKQKKRNGSSKWSPSKDSTSSAGGRAPTENQASKGGSEEAGKKGGATAPSRAMASKAPNGGGAEPPGRSAAAPGDSGALLAADSSFAAMAALAAAAFSLI